MTTGHPFGSDVVGRSANIFVAKILNTFVCIPRCVSIASENTIRNLTGAIMIMRHLFTQTNFQSPVVSAANRSLALGVRAKGEDPAAADCL